MKTFKNVLIQILLYCCLFTSAFFLVSYFTELEVIKPIEYQLYIGIATLVLSIIIIIISAKNSNTSDKEERNDDEIFEEEKSEQIAFDFDNQPISENDTVDALNKEINLEDTNTLEIQQLNIESIEEKDSTTDYQIVDAVKKATLEIEHGIVEETNNEIIEEADVNPISEETVIEQNNNENDDISIKLGFSYDEIKDKIDPNITNTQAMFIDRSTNSYFDEEGKPQLAITSNLDAKEFKLAVEEQVDNDNGEKTIDEIIDNENELLEEEKLERKSDILSVIVIVLVVLILIASAYFVITSFVG